MATFQHQDVLQLYVTAFRIAVAALSSIYFR